MKHPMQEPTIGDVLEAINEFAGHTEKRFDGIETRLTGVEKRLTSVEATMVTKDYLDEKLGELRGEFHLKLKSA